MTRSRSTGAASSEWDELEQALLEPPARAQRGTAAGAIDETFDETERSDLRRLAERARLVRSRSPTIGNVVFLHGITGSDLAVVDRTGDTDGIWVNIPRIILGRIDDLKLQPDAKKEANPKLTVRPTGVNKRYYAKAVLSLRARWNVEPYAYDWRKDIDEASDGLAALIRRRFPGQPVHFVAHSMGGLVARNFIRRHPELWETIRDADLLAGGRLVMLGTPNYGSYAIPPVLAGTDQLMEMLERLDIPHNMGELLTITNTFLGSYMLLPAPDKLPPGLAALYQHDTWGSVPGVSQQHLNRAYQFYKDLSSESTVDPTRMTYIAGCRHATISSMRILSPGEFEYGLSYLGDGRVPHELGLLPSVPTYYVDEVHGDLARNEQVLRATDVILETGKTDELVTQVLRVRDRGEPKMRDYRTAAERLLLDELERVSAKAEVSGNSDALTEEEKRTAADAIVKAALGANARSLPSRPLSTSAPETISGRKVSAEAEPVDLEVVVRFGDVTEIKAPVVVVGHYRGIPPVNAIGAIDKKLEGWIARAVRRGMISGQLGETFYVPAKGAAIAADGVVVAGMGDYGRFTPAALRQLMSNVAVGAGALGLQSIASVLVGAGEGALDRDMALREMLEGLGAGLIELREESGAGRNELRQLVLVEHKPLRFFELATQLRTMASQNTLSMVRLKVRKSLPADERRAKAVETRARAEALKRATEPRHRDSQDFDEVRITVERDSARNVFRFSALTRSAVVPVREVNVDFRNVSDVAAALRNARTRDEQEQYGRLLYTYLMPEDFHELVDGPFPVRLIVDPSTAALPWEMACFLARGNSGGMAWLGTDLGLSRQFRALLSSAPGVSPPLNDRLRVLVIADPAPEKELQLPGARAEGRRVVDLLKRADKSVLNGLKLAIEVESRIGAGECDPIDILALLLSGSFDIVHFSGHGDYRADDPKASGWIFGQDRVLTARDIFRARKIPRLVFANACFSGVLREADGLGSVDLSRSLASIAEAFLERGVPNYIGTGWPIDDLQAVAFAHRFYSGILERCTLGKAVRDARTQVFRERTESTWGAYQLYGNPNDTLLRRSGEQPPSR